MAETRETRWFPRRTSAPSRARTEDPLIKSRTGSGSNSKQKQQLTSSAAVGCSAGCSDQQNEGGILDADLAALVAAWPTLPDHIRAAIRALVGITAGPS